MTNPTILNVNDDEATRYIVTRILQRAAYTVIEAATGGEALQLIQSAADKADLVVLDVNMPDIDGIEVCRRLKADPATARLPVLHLSATRVGTEDRAYGLESGADGYLTQPVEPAVLTATVKALLRLSQAEGRARVTAQAWEAVFGAIDDGVCLLDAEERITLCNPAMVQLVGKSRADLTGCFWTEILSEAFPSATFPGDSRFSAGRRTVSEVRTAPPGEIGRWFRFTALTLVTEEHEPANRVCILADITDSKETALRQRAFLRDILASVTEGKLQLCAGPQDLPTRFAPASALVSLSRATVRELRVAVQRSASTLQFTSERAQEMETAVGEAAMNAVIHGGGGAGQICSDGIETIQAWIEDVGSGIAIDKLHLATLERGYTTAGTLGHGFWMILKTCDRVWLMTSESGTTVVLEQDREPAIPGLGTAGASVNQLGRRGLAVR